MNIEPKMICFSCMRQLKEPDGICPHCGHDNRQRVNNGQQLPFSNIGGKYLIGRCLGQGGFGITYLGYDMMQKRRVAIKEYFPGSLASRMSGDSTVSMNGEEQQKAFMTGISKFIGEAQMLSTLEDIPNIVHVYDAFLANNTAYIVMEYVEGYTLLQYLNRQKGKRISMHDALSLFEPLFSALTKLHKQNIIHRDLKPSNLMVNTEKQLILLDFGAARTYLDNENGLTAFHTTGYSPPEQYVRHSVQDGRTDEYALCATLYRCITGKEPLSTMERQIHADEMEWPSKICQDITSQQEKALLKGMSLEINQRYRTVEELKEELYAHVIKEPAGQQPAVCSFHVHYYLDGQYHKERDYHGQGKVGDMFKIRPSNVVAGYVVDRIENTVLQLVEDESKNIVSVYLKKEKEKRYTYRVRYFYDGKTDPQFDYVSQAAAGSMINIYPPRMLDDTYVVDKVENLPFRISEDENRNVVNVYMKKIDGHSKVSVRKMLPFEKTLLQTGLLFILLSGLFQVNTSEEWSDAMAIIQSFSALVMLYIARQQRKALTAQALKMNPGAPRGNHFLRLFLILIPAIYFPFISAGINNVGTFASPVDWASFRAFHGWSEWKIVVIIYAIALTMMLVEQRWLSPKKLESSVK